jgi:predicted transcriptional regulator
LPDKKTNITSVRLPRAVHQRLEQIADANGTKKTKLIRRAVYEYLAKLPR